MKITFGCPGCGASGSVDQTLAGRQIRCKQCQHRFAVPDSGDADDDGYSLNEPARRDAFAPSSPAGGPVFVPSRGGEAPIALSPRKPKRTRSGSKKRREDGPSFDWRKWSIGAGVFVALTLVLIALIHPKGVLIVGATLLFVGMLMVVVGWSAGLYGAYSEDFLYAFLYAIIPLYTAYYLVTRWDDLWRWFACSTIGLGLIAVGTTMIERSGFLE